MEERDYRFLKGSARCFDALGWAALAVGVAVSFILFFGGGGPDAPRSGGLVGLVAGGIYFLIFKALGGIIRLLLDIESRIKP